MFLGTESTVPFEYRNCSAVYLFSGTTALLMDCAEGTYGQIIDYCGGDQAKIDAIMRKTRVVHISHFHGDHVLGVSRFLLERDRVMGKIEEKRDREELFLLVPQALFEYANHVISQLNHPELVHVLPNHIFNPEKYYMHQNAFGYRCEPLNDKQVVGTKHFALKSKESIEKAINEFNVFKSQEHRDELK